MEFIADHFLFILILCFGIFVQAAAGFAAGLLIIPCLMWSGYGVPEAQTSLLVATIPQNLWGVHSFRDQISVKQTAWPGLGRVLFLPVGVFVLSQMETVSPVMLRQLVGAVVFLATLGIMFFRPAPRQQLDVKWGLLAFPLSGFLQGLVGMGGPAMVFWVQTHDWDTRRTRGFLFMMYLTSIIPALGILYVFFGDRVVRPAMVTVAVIPALLVVTYGGLKFGTWLGQGRLRKVTLGLLLLVGIAGMAAPMMEHAKEITEPPASNVLQDASQTKATRAPTVNDPTKN